MPVPRNVFRSKWAVALSAFAVGAVAAPVLGPSLRPVLRKAVKAGILTQRRLTAALAGLREELEDVVAEAKDELGESTASPRHAEHDQGAHSQHGAT